jgi:MFS family permease
VSESTTELLPVTARDVLRAAPSRWYVVTNFVLYTGVAMQATVLGKQVWDITGEELSLGMIGLAEFLPAALLVLVTGSVADRFPRKRVAALAIGVELLSGVLLLAYSLTDPTETWPFYVIAVIYGVGRAFQAPALRAMPGLVAPDRGLPRTIALSSVAWTSGVIVGPAASGIFYGIAPWVAYAVSSTLVLIGLGCLLAIRFVRPQEPVSADERPTLRSAVEGLAFVRRTPILLAAISLDLFAVLFGGAVALLPAIAEERLGASDQAYGLLRAAPGIGAAAMALLLAVKPIRRRIGPWLFAAVAVFGVGTLVLGATRTYVVAFAALVVLSAADMISVFIRSSLVPLVTPDEKRGRVLAVENVFIGASNELGAFESGVVAHLVGTPATVIGGGVGTLIVVVTWAVLFPQLRRVDRFEDLDSAHQQP